MRSAWLLAVIGLMVRCNKANAVLADAGSSASPSASLAAPPRGDAAARVTDYVSLKEAKADRDKAIGKTVMLGVTRGRLTADRVTLAGCAKKPPYDFDSLTVRYSPDARPLVRAIPSVPAAECTHVIVRLAPGKDADGEILEVLDVRPLSPSPPPPGVDFVSSDDVQLAGDAAAGKIARLMVRRQPEANGRASAPPLFSAHACDVFGTGVEVHFRAQQSAFVNGISDSVTGDCTEITVKLTKLVGPASGIWAADLM